MRSTASTVWLRAMRHQRNNTPLKHILIMCFNILIIVAGIASTIYLMRDALYITFLAMVFGTNAPHTTISEYLAFVGASSVPAICYAVIATAGFLLWRSPRYRIVGLLAVLVQAALAIYDFANPESMLDFSDWLLR